MKDRLDELSPEKLRRIAWEVGHKYPVPLTADYMALSMVHPRLGHLHWHIREESAHALGARMDGAHSGARLVVRVYDVTDIIFDGFNAHMFFDLEVNGLAGNYYFNVGRVARNYLAEVGLRCGDGSFHFLARSKPIYFDRDCPSRNYQISGLFVGGALNRSFPVENLFDARVYENMNHELIRKGRNEALCLAVVFLDIKTEARSDSPLGSFIRNFSRNFRKFGADVEVFLSHIRWGHHITDASLACRIRAVSKTVTAKLKDAHEKRPFHLLHCHDWYSSAVGMAAAKELKLPMVLSLHSTEHERTHGKRIDSLSSRICSWEETCVRNAALVIVPHSSTRQQVISLYGAPPEKVVIIPDVLAECPADAPPGPSQVKGWFGLNPEAPLVLFSGEMSHAAGADLLAEALPTVCRNHRTVQFVFAGDGPLKGELEARAWHAGIGHRCRFLGDVPRETFEALLMASEFVVIPARTWQDEGLAQLAIGCGRPVVTTRQSGINCVIHGKNGLVTFDNPGSIVWGIQELLSNPLQGSMLHVVAKKSAHETPSLENIAAQHYMYYEMVHGSIGRGNNARGA